MRMHNPTKTPVLYIIPTEGDTIYLYCVYIIPPSVVILGVWVGGHRGGCFSDDWVCVVIVTVILLFACGWCSNEIVLGPPPLPMRTKHTHITHVVLLSPSGRCTRPCMHCASCHSTRSTMPPAVCRSHHRTPTAGTILPWLHRTHLLPDRQTRACRQCC